jgi:hypothetical protein
VDGGQGEYVEALRYFFLDRPQPIRRSDIVDYLQSEFPHHADDTDLRPGRNTPTWKHDVDWALQKLKTEGAIIGFGRGWWTAE